MLRGIVEEFRAAAEKEAAEKANDPVPYAGDGD